MLGLTLKTLAVPLALAAAMPAGAAVDLVAAGPADRAGFAGRVGEHRTYYSRAWYSKEYGKLVITGEMGVPVEFGMLPIPDPALISARTASILADPLSWAMMTVGLAAIGWTMRSRLKVTDVSFV